MSQQPPDAPSGPPAYPGGPPPYPGSPPPGPGAPPSTEDAWYRPPGQSYYPPGSPPPGQWGASMPGYTGPQGYPVAAPFAGWWSRVGGALIDGIIIAAVSLIYELPAHAFRSTHTVVNGTNTLRFHFSAGGTLLPLAIGALYAGLLIGLRGQTLGMMALRIRAVDATTGGLIGFWRAIGRDLFERLLAFLLFVPAIIDLLFPLWDPRNQTLHDKVTNTVVIRV